MARVSFPTAMEVEYRGLEPASSYVNKSTGELVERPATLKLERELEDGDVIAIPVTLRDDVECDFQPDDLKRGEALYLQGEVNCWESKGGGGFFFVPTTIKRKAGAKVSPIAAAS